MGDLLTIQSSYELTISSDFKPFIENILKSVPHPNLTIEDSDWDRYIQAFVSPGFKRINTNVQTNKLLEWLGDSAIGLATSQWLIKEYEGEDEGKLTARKHYIVANEGGLLTMATDLGLNNMLRRTPGSEVKKALPSVFEALVGAMLTHLGYDYVLKFVSTQLTKHKEIMLKHLPTSYQLDQNTDDTEPLSQLAAGQYTSELLEFLTRRGWPPQTVEVLDKQEGEKNEIFWTTTVRVVIGETVFQNSSSKGSKRIAKGTASKKILEELRKKEDEGMPMKYSHYAQRLKKESDMSSRRSSTQQSDVSSQSSLAQSDTSSQSSRTRQPDETGINLLAHNLKPVVIIKQEKTEIEDERVSVSSSSNSERSYSSKDHAQVNTDYKGLLLNILTKNFPGESQPIYNYQMSGLQHDPVFSCTATLILNGKTLTATAEGRKKADSTKAASKILIDLLMKASMNHEVNAVGKFEPPHWT